MPDLVNLSLKAAAIPIRIVQFELSLANKALGAVLEAVSGQDDARDDAARFTVSPTEQATATTASSAVRDAPPSPTASRPTPPPPPVTTREKAPRPRAADDRPDPIVTPRPRRKPTKADAKAEGDLTAAEAAKVRTAEREAATTDESPGAEVHVEGTPWPGYEKQPVDEILTRLIGAEQSTKAVVRMYEMLNDNREAIMLATEDDTVS